MYTYFADSDVFGDRCFDPLNQLTRYIARHGEIMSSIEDAALFLQLFTHVKSRPRKYIVRRPVRRSREDAAADTGARADAFDRIDRIDGKI